MQQNNRRSDKASVERGVEKRKHPEAEAGKEVSAKELGKEHRKAPESKGVEGDGPVGGGVQRACGVRVRAQCMMVAGILPGHVRGSKR